MVLSIALFIYSKQCCRITRPSIIQRKKKISLSLIWSVFTPLWSLAASQSLQLEKREWSGGGGGLLLWFLRYPARAVGWSTTGSAARRFVQPFNVLLEAASLWFTSLNVWLQTAVITDGESRGDLALKRSSVYEGRSGRSGDLHVRVNPEWQPGLSHFQPWNLAHPSCQAPFLQVGLTPHGFHSQSASFTDKEAGGMRVWGWMEGIL